MVKHSTSFISQCEPAMHWTAAQVGSALGGEQHRQRENPPHIHAHQVTPHYHHNIYHWVGCTFLQMDASTLHMDTPSWHPTMVQPAHIWIHHMDVTWTRHKHTHHHGIPQLSSHTSHQHCGCIWGQQWCHPSTDGSASPQPQWS